MNETIENSTDSAQSGAIDVDSLLAQVESGETQNSENVSETQTQQVAQQPTEFEFKANGRAIKAPIDKILQYASQGYGATSKIGELNKKLSDYETRVKQYQEYESKYKPIDEYVRQNPQFWDHVLKQWETVQGQAAQNPQAAIDPSHPLFQEIQGIKGYISQLQEREQLAARQAEDQQLDQQIQSIREQYKDLDWNAPDENGLNLEAQILSFASERGIKDFEAAFRAAMFDRMVKRAEERGKESLAKEREKQTKLGLLGKTPAPKQGITRLENSKNKSDQDVLREALEELGIA